jgi:hypothetical protein
MSSVIKASRSVAPNRRSTGGSVYLDGEKITVLFAVTSDCSMQ